MPSVRLCLFLALHLLLSPAVAGEDPPAAARGAGGDEYVVGVEDVLRIVVWEEPALSLTVKVRPDGKITVPLIHDIDVVGMTPSAIRDRIASSLANFVRDPSVTVIVEQINSFRVYFLGEINAQGAIQFYRPTRLLQAIATAGGLSQFSKKEIILIREEYGVEKRMKIDYKRLLSGDPAQENVYLRPGDTLLFN